MTNAKAGGTSSTHKIPVNSLPAHTHSMRLTWVDNHAGNIVYATGSGNRDISVDQGAKTGSVGGGQAYYPYYIGVYVWKRTA